MNIIFGGLNRGNRRVEMSSYFQTVSAALSLSRPNLFRNSRFGVATGSLSRGHTGAGVFRDADRQIVVAVQGDIVNRGDLEKELRAGSAPAPDERWDLAEFVSRMYASYGLEFVSKLDGYAQIVIWHERDERLLLLPDPYGFRPFYYVDGTSTFLFASSIKAILRHPAAVRAVNTDALYELLTLGFVLPPDTLFSGVNVVSSGTYLEFVDGPAVRPFPIEPAPQLPESDEDPMAKQYLALLEHAVSTRVQGADRAAVLLSGGVDSSAVVRLLRAGGTREIVTYYMHLDAADREEREAAREVSRLFGTEHLELTDAAATLNRLPEIVWQLEVPRVEVVGEHALCASVPGDGPPVLTGDGNDIPWGLLSPAFVERSGKNVAELYQLLRQRMPDETAGAMLPRRGDPHLRMADRIEAWSRTTGNLFRDLISLDRRLFGAHFVNRMIGKLRIEHHPGVFRCPYLDRRVLEFVASVPDRLRVRPSDNGRMIWKYLFKRSLEIEGSLPGRVIHRKKAWMHHPTSAWLRDEFGARVERLVRETGREPLRYFDRKYVDALWREHRAGKSDHTHALETVLGFVLWHKIFIEPKACERPAAGLIEMF